MDEGFWKTALGVFVGGLAALIVFTWLQNMAVRYELAQAMQALNEQTAAVQRQAASAAATQRAAARARELAEAQRLENERQQRENAEAERLNALGKENTFQRRYVPPPQCAKDPSTIECANDYVRAKKAFEAAWGR